MLIAVLTSFQQKLKTVLYYLTTPFVRESPIPRKSWEFLSYKPPDDSYNRSVTSKYVAFGAITIFCVACKSITDKPELSSAIPQVAPKSTDKLYPVRIGEKCGYIDVTGKVVIPAQWEFAAEFREGLALVSNDWGNYSEPGMTADFIDYSGKVVVKDILVDDIGLQGFSEGLAPFLQNGKVGFIDKAGKVVIPAKYYCEPGDDQCGCVCEDGAVGEFKNGVTWAKLGHTEILIDRTGKELLKGENVRNASNRYIEGLAPYKKRKLYGYKNLEGKVVIPAKYTFAGEFCEGVSFVTPQGLENQFVYIDKTGKQISDKIFEYPANFSEGFALATYEGFRVIVSKDGKTKRFPPLAGTHYPHFFKNGLFMATITKNDTSKDVFIDQNGEIIAEFEISSPGAFREKISTPFDGHLAEIYCQGENSARWVDRNGKTVWSSKTASK
ncbi:MAG: WG repeat-containing protein [Fimbriimonadaceae bacterium]|nr:WG repeat-containing protein [Fimbriimonadaceae bacterium]